MRRVDIQGNLDLNGPNPGGSLGFGSFARRQPGDRHRQRWRRLAGEPAQAQYYIRGTAVSAVGTAPASTMVFSGVQRRPGNALRTRTATPPCAAHRCRVQHRSSTSSTDKYQVFVPTRRPRHIAGLDWSSDHRAGRSHGNRPVLHRQAHRHRRDGSTGPCRREEPPPDAGRVRPGGTDPGDPPEHRGPGPGLRHADARPGAQLLSRSGTSHGVVVVGYDCRRRARSTPT